jgi:hypothetical protein
VKKIFGDAGKKFSGSNGTETTEAKRPPNRQWIVTISRFLRLGRSLALLIFRQLI